MKPIDKFGNTIYPRVFQKLQSIGSTLERLGFTESTRKPNLFYRIDEGLRVFADMRGTVEIPIWDEPYPLIYIKHDKEIRGWKIVRKTREVTSELSREKVKFRFSFYEECEPKDTFYPEIHHKETFQDGLFIFFYNIYQELPDGYCRMCMKDLGDDLYFCSKEHEAATTENSFSMIVAGSPKCEICGAIELHPINEEFKEYLQKSNMVCVPSLVIHHTSYFPEIGMEICPSCHSRIHHANDLGLNKYRPPDGDSDKFYEKRKRTEKLEGKYSKIDQEARIFDPLRFFEGLTFYQLNVMRADAGILPEEYDNNALRKYHEKHPDAKDYMRCEKCSFEFDPQYRTTCPKCRWFFR